MKRILAVLIMVLPLFAAEPQCKENPRLIGACYKVHGRLDPGADTVELRLWRVGTKRILGISSGPSIDDASYPIFPNNLKFPHSESICGDFEVCPFTRERKGTMRLVCIESASHLVVKP